MNQWILVVDKEIDATDDVSGLYIMCPQMLQAEPHLNEWGA